MPTKTGDKVRIIVLGTGPDAETARLIAESDADVALAKQFTKTVTHLVIDDTVKATEARLKKAEEAGVPVLSFAEFKALLVAGAEDEVEEAAVEEVVEAELEEAPAETPVAVDTEPEPEPEPDIVDEPGPVVVEPETEPVEEPEPVADPDPAIADEPGPAAEAETAAEKDDVVEPVAEAIDEPEEVPADPEKSVPSQADAPAIETDAKGSKPSFIDKIKSIFGKSTVKK
ncbi:hypothetical protein [Glycomyces algeriensis]|uniref:BRCT domain-containing protein n=1 Tax=Glycomyces algeriensis TaxID=256037 RepID=A0A9W6LEC1_9ACTN|nr:hypothetical protein [Glycomyces algeriensis]MDA1367563.1 hypothetical protein [Glycomyces algeriensis]MDR7353074.1 outer membrane biosynthesis protein TonB [Glycomyces algeriensis]GLI40767.1 hypothetical protein GALLR39Z86_06170 [Glycomyces algeriensis]